MIYGSPNLNIERSKIDHIPFVDIQSNGLKVATLHLFLWLTQEACKKFASNLLDASDAKALQVALGSNAIVSLNFILVILYFQNSGHVLQQRVVQDSPCSPYLEKLLVTFWWFL